MKNLKCPHCGRAGGASAMKRWHFDNCKYKKDTFTKPIKTIKIKRFTLNGYFILAVALSLSGVAGYYSIVGLATLFAAAAIPVIIMGTVLEVAKLVTASWLYQNWSDIPVLMRSYFTLAVLVLMFITSMGIFGFLSKAHIEQTGEVAQQSARIEQIDQQTIQLDDLISRKETKITELSSKDSNSFNTIQSQIDREQANIDSVYARIKPDVDRLQLLIDNAKEKKQAYDTIPSLLAEGNVSEVQRLIGVEIDGNLGPKTKKAIDAFMSQAPTETPKLDSIIAENEAKILELKTSVEPLVKESTDLISKLKSQITMTDTGDLEAEIAKLESEIEETNAKKTALLDEKFSLESEIRKFEVEVGPVKYVAEFIYGEADKTVVEKAVRWVILIIIFVFDPLAVLLVIAANMTIQRDKEEDPLFYDVPKSFDINKDGDIIDTPISSEPVINTPQTDPVEKKVSHLGNTRNFKFYDLLKRR